MSRYTRWFVSLCVGAAVVGFCPLEGQDKKPGATQDSINADQQAQIDSLRNVAGTHNILIHRLFAMIDSLHAMPPDTVPPPADGDTALIVATDSASVTIEATWTTQRPAIDEALKTRPDNPRLNDDTATSPYTFTAPRLTAARRLLVAIERWDRRGATPIYIGDDTLGIVDIPAGGVPPDTLLPPPPDTLPPPPSGWDIPTDAVKVTERGFNVNGGDNWSTNAGGANRYVSDPSAPIDPDIVLEMPFGPCASCGSSGLGNKVVKNWVNRDGLPSGREVWIEHVLKYSANWASNPAANKIYYPTVRNKANHPTFIGTRPTTVQPDAPLRIALSLGGQDNTACGHAHKSIWFNGAMPGAEIKRGQWHTVRTYLRTNDHGVCNAVVKIWVDGHLVVNATNFIFVEPGVSNEWWALNFDPVYGGGPAPIPAEQTLRTAYMSAHVR